jgi:hypothetical protein
MAVTFDEVTAQLVMLASKNGGVLTAELAERDRRLAAADRNVVAAAARSLDGTTNVFGLARTSTGWFPFEELRFTGLAPSASST